MLRLVCAVVAAAPGANTPITKVSTGGAPVAPCVPPAMAEMPAMSEGAHSLGGKPGRKPPGSPSVTRTTATR